MLGLSLTVRYAVTLMGVVLFSAAAGLGWWAHDYVGRRAAALEAHAGLVLRDLADAVEARLGLGLPLAQLPEIDRLLDGARQQIPAVQAISLVDDKGRAVFSTDASALGDEIALWPAGAEPDYGRRLNDEEAVFWLPLTNEYGGLAGAAVVRLPAGAVRGETWSFVLSLAARLSPVLAGLLAAAAGLGVLTARRVDPATTAVAAALSGLAGAGETPNDEIGIAEAEAVSGLPLAQFAAAVRAGHAALAAGEQELGRLDELA